MSFLHTQSPDAQLIDGQPGRARRHDRQLASRPRRRRPDDLPWLPSAGLVGFLMAAAAFSGQIPVTVQAQVAPPGSPPVEQDPAEEAQPAPNPVASAPGGAGATEPPPPIAADAPASVDSAADSSGQEADPSGDDVSDADLAAIEAALAGEDDDDPGAAGGTAGAAQSGSLGAAGSFGTAGSPDTAAGGGSVQSMNPDISLVADFALAAFSNADSNLQTGEHDPSANGFNLQQLELSAGASVDPYFRFDANLVFGLFDVEVEEAYGTTLDLPAKLQVRFGQFLHRFGRINATHPHAWDFVDQPIAIGRVFGGDGGRGLGVELSWLSPLPWYVEVLASATQANGEGSARSFYGEDNFSVQDPSDLLYVAAIKQFFPLNDDWSLLQGLSAAFGPNGTGRGNRTELYGADLFLKYRPIGHQSSQVLALTTEWIYRRRQAPMTVLADLTGYGSVMWKFAERWSTAVRYEFGAPPRDPDGATVADDLDPAWDGDRHRLSLAFSFLPTEFSRLRLQGAADVPAWLEQPIYSIFLAAEVVAGAHGAHAF